MGAEVALVWIFLFKLWRSNTCVRNMLAIRIYRYVGDTLRVFVLIDIYDDDDVLF